MCIRDSGSALASTPAALHSAKVAASHHQQATTVTSAFKDKRATTVDRINSLLFTEEGTLPTGMRRAAHEAPYEPFLELPKSNLFGDMDAPGGERWYYTASYTYDSIPPHIADDGTEIAFTELILRHYKYTFYDSAFKALGTIEDDMEYRGVEVRVPRNGIDAAPVVTQHFFNTDDNYEIIIGMAVNAEIGVNHYRSLVYSLNGEKDEKGNDLSLIHI